MLSFQFQVLATPPCPLLDQKQQEVLDTSDDAIKFFADNKVKEDNKVWVL
jgi:hypothetical protein